MADLPKDPPRYGEGTARLERNGEGRLVAVSDTPISDEDLFSLIDAGRR